ncbi:hypothetical protein LCGC14_1380550 [marine sediment metagenome]|uniref:DUF1320 domain-containing protein n=1 Tax=marine sediment metagenome TaxID=412755 RepID=A0A0F9K2X9_9ZZZZ
MGNYATTTDLANRFENDAAVAHLTDTAETGTPDTDVLDEVISGAEGLINSYGARKYDIPFSTSDTGFASFLKSLTLDIAVFNLVGARGDLASEAKTTAYEKALEWLEKLAEGKVIPPATATQTTTAARDPVAAFGTAGTGDSSKRLFSRSTQANL